MTIEVSDKNFLFVGKNWCYTEKFIRRFVDGGDG